MGKIGSFHTHVLENRRALELLCHRRIKWAIILTLEMLLSGFAFSGCVVGTICSTYKLKLVFKQWLRLLDSGTDFQQMASIVIFGHAMTPSKAICF